LVLLGEQDSQVQGGISIKLKSQPKKNGKSLRGFPGTKKDVMP
jgi:hypothetical protein